MRRHWLSLLAVLAMACGSSSSDAPPTGGTDTGSAGDDTAILADTSGDDTLAPPDAIVDEYPPGPYGIKTGDILEDFELTGYDNHDSSQVSTTAELRTLRLSDVRAASKSPYMFIHEVGFF